MSKRFISRTFVITGAVGALGETMVHGFAKEGANVVVAARKETEGNKLAKFVGENAMYVLLDVTSEKSWSMRLPKPKVDSVLINNAAYLVVGTVESVPLTDLSFKKSGIDYTDEQFQEAVKLTIEQLKRQVEHNDKEGTKAVRTDHDRTQRL